VAAEQSVCGDCIARERPPPSSGSLNLEGMTCGGNFKVILLGVVKLQTEC